MTEIPPPEPKIPEEEKKFPKITIIQPIVPNPPRISVTEFIRWLK